LYDWNPKNNNKLAISTREENGHFLFDIYQIKKAKINKFPIKKPSLEFRADELKYTGKYLFPYWLPCVITESNVDIKATLFGEQALIARNTPEDDYKYGAFQIINIDSKKFVTYKKTKNYLYYPNQIVFHPTKDAFLIYNTTKNNGTTIQYFEVKGDEMKLMKKWTYDKPYSPKNFSPDGKYLALAPRKGKKRIYFMEFASGKILKKSLKGHNSPIVRIEFSKDGKYIGSTSEDNQLKIWKNPLYQKTLKEKDFEERIKFLLDLEE